MANRIFFFAFFALVFLALLGMAWGVCWYQLTGSLTGMADYTKLISELIPFFAAARQ